MRAKILNASAGSGKTYQLAYKYVRDVIDQPGLYRHILAVTFTNKATEEMKSRILKEIHRLASGGASPYLGNLCRELSLDERSVRKRAAEVRSKILHDYSRFTVLTIDTFFQRILRAFIKELGIDLNYNVEIETASVLSKGADTLIEQITVDRDLQRWLTEFVQERIDEGRKWDIRDGILSLGGELFKEKNKDALSVPRSREELGRIVSRAAAQAEATKKQLQQTAARAVAIISRAGLTAADFSGKSRSFANYFFTVAAGELKPYGATVAKMAAAPEGWGAKGSPAQALAPELQPLLRALAQHFDLSRLCEYTGEAGRPDTVTAEKLAVLAENGVTRVSINPQTMEEAVLEAIGRRHSAADVYQAMELAKASGIPHINMDLIAGLPTDTPEGFSRTLDKCLALAPDNLTVHTLALKKGSRILLDGLPVPGAAEVGQMLDYSAAHLSQAGYTPYYLYRQKYMSGNFENVGWSKPGAEGLYNIYIMEELHSILSVGAGGSTKLVDPRTGHIVRHFNCKYAKEYLEKPEKWTQNRAQFFAFERALLRDYGLLPEENTEGSDS